MQYKTGKCGIYGKSYCLVGDVGIAFPAILRGQSFQIAIRKSIADPAAFDGRFLKTAGMMEGQAGGRAAG